MQRISRELDALDVTKLVYLYHKSKLILNILNSNTMPRVKIISGPDKKMAKGGNAVPRPSKTSGYADQTSGYVLNLGNRVFDPSFSLKQPFKASESIQEVPREMATLEAEKGEVLTRQEKDGGLAKFDIGGKKHYDGGTPLAGQPGDFIFSDFKKLAIGGPIVELFGKPANTSKKYTPAELAKQYDINKYKAIIDNPDSDALAKSTAERQIVGFEKKLGGIAIIQEAKKGFPQGMPQLMGNNEKGIPQAKYGGYLPKAQQGWFREIPIQPGGSGINTPNVQAPTKKVKIIAAPKTPYQGPINYADSDQIAGVLGSNYMPSPATSTPYSGLPLAPGYTPTQEDYESQGPLTQAIMDKMPGVNYPQSSNQQRTVNVNQPTGDISGNLQTYNAPYGISNADRRGIFANALVPPHMGTPIRSQVRFPFSHGIAPDERAAIAAQQSAGNAAMQANAITGDGSRVRASNTGIVGKELEGLQDLEGKYANIKGDFYNREAARSDEQKMKEIDANTQYAQQYNQQSDTAKFNYDQSVKNYLNTAAKDKGQAEKNAAKRQNLNMINAKDPFYADNNSLLRWRQGYTAPDGPGSVQQSPDDMYAARLAFYKANGDTHEQASLKAHQDLRDHRTRMSGSVYNPQSQKYVNTSSPDIQNLNYQGYGNDQYYNQGYNTGMQNWQGLP